MPKLNQILAIEKGVKNDAFLAITDVHQRLQKATLLAGISRTYRPRDEDGEQLPPESTRVQLNADDAIKTVAVTLAKLFDVTATKEWTNSHAKADVVVDGQTLVTGAPATFLLFLEKQIVDLHTFVAKLPVLDPSETWEYDLTTACYATPVTQTVRTKKIPRNHVLVEATKDHPAQVQVYTEDIGVGTWNTVKFSGALPARQVNDLRARLEKLQQAVKFAREEANSVAAQEQKVGATILDWLFV